MGFLSDKSDVAAAESLASMPLLDLSKLVPELLTWLQDGNWPVARPVARALTRCGAHLVEPVRDIFRSNDDSWKYWTMALLLSDVEPPVRIALESDLLRIVNTPTQGEIAEDAHLAARDVYFLLTYNDSE